METDFGKRDTFYLEIHGLVNHFHYCTFYMDVFTGFEADNDSVCISHELDMISGCLKIDSLFFFSKVPLLLRTFIKQMKSTKITFLSELHYILLSIFCLIGLYFCMKILESI